MDIFGPISGNFKYFMTELADPRVKDKFLMSSPLPTLGITAFYLVLVKYILPQYMKNRPAVKLNSVLFYYNWFQIILSSAIVYKSYGSGYFRRFSLFKCRDLDQSTTDADALMALSAVYLFYLSKFTEFFDTIFFILRKKSSQVTFLHVFHHASMPVNAWIIAKIYPGGSCTLVAGVNASVHVVMYTYYMLSGLGPRWQKYLWWKKYLTTFQLGQFTFGLVLVVAIFIDQSECPAFKKRMWYLYYAFAYMAILLYLFNRFYSSTYVKYDDNGNKVQQNIRKIK